MVDRDPISRVQRRVGGEHDYRCDGLTDLLVHCQGMSVLDLGCNRGMICHEFACHGARLVHGCDYVDAEAVHIARRVFADIRQVQSRFEVVDLSKGPASLDVFGDGLYDIILLLGTYHKIRRQMPAELLTELIQHLGARTTRYFAWRGYAEEQALIERDFRAVQHRFKMELVHWSDFSGMGPAAIWRKKVETKT